LGRILKHNEELYEFNIPDVKNIEFKIWQWSGPTVRIDYARIPKQLLNGELKEAPSGDYGRDGKNVRRRN
jgi:hypothetical protein